MFRTKPGEERALIEDWINRPALRKLVETYGGNWPTGGLREIVAELVAFSKVWDYRAGELDRHMFHDLDKDDSGKQVTYQAASELGLMMPSPPSNTSYEYLLILGGLATGVEPRVRYAASLVEGGLKIHREIAALGSFRPLQERELPISSKYAPQGKFEVDHLSAMLAIEFDAVDGWDTETTGDPATRPSSASLSSTRPVSSGPDLGVYAAPSSDPANRLANTADTYEFLARVGQVGPGDIALVVTSAIYVPYQHVDAVRTLGRHGVTIETIGVQRASRGPTHAPSAYRQEIRSAIQASHRLFESGILDATD